MSWALSPSLLPLADTYTLYHLARAWGVPRLPHTSFNRLVAQLESDYDPAAWFRLGLRIYCTTIAYVANDLWATDCFRVEPLTTVVVLRPSAPPSSPSAARTGRRLTYSDLRRQLASPADPLLARLLTLADSLNYYRSQRLPFAPCLSSMPRFRSSMPRAGVSGLVVLPYSHQTSYSSLPALWLWPLTSSLLSEVTFSQAVAMTTFCLLVVEYMVLYRTLLDLLLDAAANEAPTQEHSSDSQLSLDTSAIFASAYARSLAQDPASTPDAPPQANSALPPAVYRRFLDRLAAYSTA